ncbi:hypothetical protein UFOVP658_87 [uncultured Caudovirales phage]|jgi:hypothetical protein|uniref:Uncharacterized protein n=1 Tax=uncultured Caudovirales phage TaxID=2100421 RepID=A0A6J5NBZ1_9CAUD|nr:hypothetical protein UFOVP658_87 [uncultured Caudovirales phage]
MSRFEEDDELLEEYSRYVKSFHGVPEDYDTWVHSEYGESKKRTRSPRRHNDKGLSI